MYRTRNRTAQADLKVIIVFIINMLGFLVLDEKTALRHNCTMKGNIFPVIYSDSINGNNKRKLFSTNLQKCPTK